jgi:gliding motility-associated protein GldM
MGETSWSPNFENNAIQLTGDSGIVKLPIETGNMKPGEYSFAGRIGIKKPNSDDYSYHNFSSSFHVLEPSANVAATKMNVFYRGVDNPVSISAAGVPASEVEYEIRGDGRIQQQTDGLVVNNLKKKTVNTVKVLVFRNNGEERKQLGEQEFRVKDLPPPEVFVSGMNDAGVVGKGGFLANPYIRSSLPEYVNFEYKYRVTSFTMWVKKNGSDYPMRSNSNKLSGDMVNYIQGARKSSKLFFTDIEVQGPLEKFKVKGALVITLN